MDVWGLWPARVMGQVGAQGNRSGSGFNLKGGDTPAAPVLSPGRECGHLPGVLVGCRGPRPFVGMCEESCREARNPLHRGTVASEQLSGGVDRTRLRLLCPGAGEGTSRSCAHPPPHTPTAAI